MEATTLQQIAERYQKVTGILLSDGSIRISHVDGANIRYYLVEVNFEELPKNYQSIGPVDATAGNWRDMFTEKMLADGEFVQADIERWQCHTGGRFESNVADGKPRYNRDFSEAIQALLKGRLVQREGWAESGRHLYLEEHFRTLVGKGGGFEHIRTYKHTLMLYLGNKTHQPGWLPSMDDLMATDWQIIEGEALTMKI